MEKTLISLESLKALKHEKAKVWLFVGVLLVLFAVFVLCGFLFQNRDTQVLWIVFGTIVTSFVFVTLAFVFIKIYAPLFSYASFCHHALSKKRPINDVEILEIYGDKETYKGFSTRVLLVKEKDELKRWKVYYEASEPLSLKLGRLYEIETSDEVLVRIKEEL
jgi:hypothetical protein